MFIVIICLLAIAVTAFAWWRLGWKSAFAALSGFLVAVYLAVKDLVGTLWTGPLVPPGANDAIAPLSLVTPSAASTPSALWPILIVVGTVVVLYTVYRVARKLLPGYGTWITNGVVVLLALVDMLQALPWTAILGPKEIGWLLMGFGIVNGIMRSTPSTSNPPMLPAGK